MKTITRKGWSLVLSALMVLTLIAAYTPTAHAFAVYPVWVGETQVTGLNQNDVLGDEGSVQYDPETSTLYMNHPTITTQYEKYNQIYANNTDLTIKGSVELDSHYGVVGVKNGSLTIDADLSAAGPFSAIWADNGVTIQGGHVSTESGSVGISAPTVRITGGIVDVNGFHVGMNTQKLIIEHGIEKVEIYGETVSAVDNVQELVVVDGVTMTYPEGGILSSELHQITLPNGAATVYVVFEPTSSGGGNSSTYKVTVTGGSASLAYAAKGTTVSISAQSAPTGSRFKEWEVTAGEVTLADKTKTDTSFVMPDTPVSLNAVYVAVAEITFDANGGSGTMAVVNVDKGDKLTLPECTFTPPEGKVFDRWEAGSPGEQVEITDDSVIRAFWKDGTAEPSPTPDPDPTPTPTPDPTPAPTPDPTPTPGTSFTDVGKDAYYADAVQWAVGHDPQITTGTSSSTFSPDGLCTRGQAVTFLWRTAGCPKPTGTANPFTDVASDAYYYEAVLWAVEKNITNGTSATTFSPDQSCTRGQIVTFLHRFESTPAPGSANNPFTDVASDAYYYQAVLWAVEKNITNGTSVTTFSPDQTCTRGQIVTFLYRDRK